MKTPSWIYLCLLISGTGMFACQSEDETPTPDIVELSFNFEENEEGWVAGFADLPEEGQESYELEVSHSLLPEETGATENSIRIQGHNRSDDLFMFLKKQLTDLSPSTTYQVYFDIEI